MGNLLHFLGDLNRGFSADTSSYWPSQQDLIHDDWDMYDRDRFYDYELSEEDWDSRFPEMDRFEDQFYAELAEAAWYNEQDTFYNPEMGDPTFLHEDWDDYDRSMNEKALEYPAPAPDHAGLTLSDIVLQLNQSNPDHAVTAIRQQHDAEKSQHGARRRNARRSNKRRVHTHSVVFRKRRAYNTCAHEQPWQVYAGNKLRERVSSRDRSREAQELRFQLNAAIDSM
jgi:hypothetical protein